MARSSSLGLSVKNVPSLIPLAAFADCAASDRRPAPPAAMPRRISKWRLFMSIIHNLKKYSHSELDVAVASAFRDLSIGRLGHVGARAPAIELRMIEDVVKLRAELDVVAL